MSQVRLIPMVAHRVITGRGARLARFVALFTVAAFIIGIGTFTVGALKPTPEQSARHLMGKADGLLYPTLKEFANPADLLAGQSDVRADPIVNRTGYAVFAHGLQREIPVLIADWSVPVARSGWDMTSGRWPVGASEVALTSGLARRIDVHAGGTVRMGDVAAALTVSGIARDPSSYESELLFGGPALGRALDGTAPDSSRSTNIGFYLSGTPAAVAAVVATATNHGLAANTRDQLLGEKRRSLLRDQLQTVALPGILLVVVLSAAAMIVRVRRAGRQLAILMALGVRPGVLVWAARFAAASAALLGALLGTALTAAVSLAVTPALSRATKHDIAIGPATLRSVLFTLAIVVGTAVLAALLPARVARQGQRTFDGKVADARSRGSALPAALAGLAVASCAVAVRTSGSVLGTTSVVIAVCAAAAFVPATLRALSAWSVHTSTTVRLGTRALARDARRPTAAAVLGMTAMIAAVGSMTYYGSMRTLERHNDASSTHAGAVAVPLHRIGPTSELIEQLRQVAGPGGRVGAWSIVIPAQEISRTNRLLVSNYDVGDAEPGTGSGLGAAQSVDDFVAIAGRTPSEREWNVLTSGGILDLVGNAQRHSFVAPPLPGGPTTPPTAYRSGGRVVISAGGPAADAPVPDPFTVTTVASDPVADRAHLRARFLVGPRFVADRHLQTLTTHLVAIPGHGLDPGLGNAVRRVAEAHGISASGIIFRTGLPPPLPFDWRLVLASAIAVLWIGIGLTLLAMSEDARPFYQLLFALGFGSRRQRSILVVQGAAIAAVAVVYGAALGMVAGSLAAHVLPIAADVGSSVGLALVLSIGAIAGAALIGALRPGQRSIDELVV